MRNLPVAAVVVLLLAGCTGESSKSEDAFGAANTTSAAAAEDKKAPVPSGPFGFSFGTDISKVEGAKLLEGKTALYSVASPPKPHPDFESVVLEAYPGVGICIIRGIGRDLEGDGAGVQIRTKVDSLAEALATKYGKPKKNDVCSGSEISCQEQFWVMNMTNGERWYGHSWETANAVMKQNGIGEITLAARAADIQTTYPVLEFLSANKAQCAAAAKASAADAL